MKKNSSVTVAKPDCCAPKSLECTARILGSVNGLICLRKDLFTLMLLNPCTGKFCVFRDFIIHYGSPGGCFVRYGFGYNASTEDYKVVKIFSFIQIEHGRHENMVRVYSLKARSWSNKLDFNSGYINGKVGVFANGALHWEERDGASWDIVTLDLAAMRYGKIALPSYDQDGGMYWTLGVSRGYLVACCNYDEPNRADMWVMKEYGVEKSWTKLVTILSSVDGRGYISPLFVAGNGDEVLLKLGREIILYNSSDGSFKRLYHYPSGEFIQFQVATYFEILASPHI